MTTYDWVTSKGFLTRTAIFDEVGGPDPRLWPLNHVDKDYCTHLRCHGYVVALAPAARAAAHGQPVLAHDAAQLPQRLARDVVRPALARSARGPRGTPRGRGAHPCADWRTDALDDTAGRRERRGRRRGRRMLVPLSRYAARERTAARRVEARLDDSRRLPPPWMRTPPPRAQAGSRARGGGRALAHQAEILAAAEAGRRPAPGSHVATSAAGTREVARAVVSRGG